MTLINLFYKPLLSDVGTSFPNLFQRLWVPAVTASTCPLYGFKCPTDEPCDCDRICSNGEFVPFHVMPNEPIYLTDRQLSPGTYCLPKGIGNCNQKTSYHVFSLTGWKCISRNTALYRDESLSACQNEDALDNSQNVLWDNLLNLPARDIENPYEVLADGTTLRYKCHCDSLDIRGKKLVATLPFVCSVDYCVRDFMNPHPHMGFTGSKCECGVYLHADPTDEMSPCVAELMQVKDDQFVGRVECMSNFSWQKSAIFCPKDRDVLSFNVPVMGGTSERAFLTKQLK